MIEYLLVVLICAPGECHWQRIYTFPTEEACEAAGSAITEATLYKCVMQQSDVYKERS